LSAREENWKSSRREKTAWALGDFLVRANITGFNVGQYIERLNSIQQELPKIGIAISGGGYRALMTGAGAVAAFDNRTTNSTAVGQLGGLLQASTYLSGLSGGSWLIGSLYMQGFSPVERFLNGSNSTQGSLWQFENSILEGMRSRAIHVKKRSGY
jgi:lysophospholipase